MNRYDYPKLTISNKYVLIISGFAFLSDSILRAIGAFSLSAFLGLSGAGLMSGKIWQLFTFPFMETQLFSYLFNILLIWFIGSELEQLWGTRLYARFLLLVNTTCGLIYSFFVLFFFNGTSIYFSPLAGLSGINFSLLISYAFLYPDRALSMMMIFPMRARTFCLILVAVEAYMAIFSNYLNSWAHLMAMGVSYLVVRFQNNFIIHKLLNFELKRKIKRKNHLYVVPDKKNDSDHPKYWQ